MSDDILARLREAATPWAALPLEQREGLTLTQVQHGLERAQVKFAALWMSSTRSGIEVWTQIEQAFCEGVRDA